MQFAHVTLCGRVTREPSIRGRDKDVTAFSVAINRSWKKADTEDEYVERTTFVDITSFGAIAKRAARLHKGALVTVAGRLEMGEDWTDAEGNERKGRLQVVADEVEAAVPLRQAVERRTVGHGSPRPRRRHP
jgi:single-strand DNA-binding protein